MTRRWGIIVALTLLALVTLACAESGGTTYRPTPTPTLAGVAGAYLAAEQAEAEHLRVAAQATAQAAQAALTVQAAAAAEDAAQAVLRAQAEATAQAINARATIQALDAQATAQAMALAATQTAEANNATATVQAAAVQATAAAESCSTTATTEARNARATTQAGRMTATAESRRDSQTATIQSHRDSLTATTDAGILTVQAGIIERDQMELERERITQPLRTWGPWLIVVLGLAAAAYFGYRAFTVWELRKRALERDARGDAPLLALAQAGGGVVILDPDRCFGPATTIIDGQVTAPQLVPPEYQERTTARDQLVDLRTRGLPGASRPSPRQRQLPTRLRLGPPPARPQIRMIPPEQALPWIQEVEGQLMEEEAR